MEKLLIRNAKIYRNGELRPGDLLIDDGRIAALGEALDAVEGAREVDASGCYLLPGLVDVHVHLREPGFTAKETIRTGTLAAAHGGYTAVCAMPNLRPAPDAPETLAVEEEAIRRDAVVRVYPYASITCGRRGAGRVVDFAVLRDRVIGFSDDGCGVQEEAVMLEAMRGAKAAGRPIVAHCEVNELLRGGYIHDGVWCREHGHKGICSESEWRQVERDIELVRRTGCQYHVCHVSTAQSVELVRQAKAEGLPVSCETAPHYLLLCDEDLREEGRFKMNPPIRSRDDQMALLNGIIDGTIEVVATDHAPHTAEEKSRGLVSSAMGIVGLESAFVLLHTYLVRRGILTFTRLMELMAEAPRRIFGIPGGMEVGEAADVMLFDPEAEGRVDPGEFLSMGRSTPFEGWRTRGRVLWTAVGGRTAWASAAWKAKLENKD